MTVRKSWSRNDLLVAYYLYCRLPFGQFNSSNKTVIEYSSLMGRTPSSLAMKLGNIASLDPAITKTGRVGLPGASKADREMWAEMNGDWDAFATKTEQAVSGLGIEAPQTDDNFELVATADYSGREVSTLTQVRVGQSFFRQSVLSAYGNRCCISGLAVPTLLIASHIKPWKSDVQNRLNPHNGLCLSMLHDRAFDKGIITLNTELKILVSAKYKSNPDNFFKESILRYEGMEIDLPAKFLPDLELLKHHRESIFIP